jgi:hypothetical protein
MQCSKLHDGHENTVGAMIAACYHRIGLLRSALFSCNPVLKYEARR